jgi:hypothetical protein
MQTCVLQNELLIKYMTKWQIRIMIKIRIENEHSIAYPLESQSLNAGLNSKITIKHFKAFFLL